MMAPFSELSAKFDLLCEKLDRIESAVRELPINDQRHSPQYREWQPFVVWDGGTTDANGDATIGNEGSNLIPAPNGWEAFVDRVSVTVQGASSAGRVSNYRGPVADQNLFDYANALFGNTPSRNVADYNSGVYFTSGEAVTIFVDGAVATQTVVVRIEGRRRQV